MKSFCALRQLIEVSLFERLGERVEQRPDVPRLECVMWRFSPFMKHRRNEPVEAHANIAGANEEIMCLGIFDFSRLGCADAFILVVPLVYKKAGRPFHQLRQITIDEASVLSSEYDPFRKRQIGAPLTADQPFPARLSSAVSGHLAIAEC